MQTLWFRYHGSEDGQKKCCCGNVACTLSEGGDEEAEDNGYGPRRDGVERRHLSTKPKGETGFLTGKHKHTTCRCRFSVQVILGAWLRTTGLLLLGSWRCFTSHLTGFFSSKLVGGEYQLLIGWILWSCDQNMVVQTGKQLTGESYVNGHTLVVWFSQTHVTLTTHQVPELQLWDVTPVWALHMYSQTYEDAIKSPEKCQSKTGLETKVVNCGISAAGRSRTVSGPDMCITKINILKKKSEALTALTAGIDL